LGGWFEVSPGKEFARPYLKKKEQKTQNRAGVVAQEVEHLPSKYEALSSNPTTTIMMMMMITSSWVC
jgi:hypothetical protein